MTTLSKEEKKIVRLISAFSDMSDAVKAAKLLMGGVTEDLYAHLLLSMVVAYGRPFTENRGAGHIQCDYPNYPDFGDADMPDRHKRLLDLRNKFLAHSSAEGTRVEIIPAGVTNPRGGRVQSSFEFNMGKRTFPDIRFVEWLMNAPVSFGIRLHSDIQLFLQKTFQGRADLTAAFELRTGHEGFRWT